MRRLHVHIQGVVQGVGFRPFIHSLAHRFNLTGWVVNDSRGVEIEIDGSSRDLDSFLKSLQTDSPPLAQIVSIDHEFLEIPDSETYKSFEIHRSVPVEGERVLISPDVAVCHDCLREMYDPADRRYRYPFLNCTNCGPRFTIIEDLPYDRPNTTMREFPMCENCLREFVDPGDRRFHAQPTCCPVCGPTLQFLDENGNQVDGDPINQAIDALRSGKIIAIKGIGGFHLVCDASNTDAVLRLRERKHREAKPLAVMVGGIGAAKTVADLNDDAARALLSPARPIVILPENPGSSLAANESSGVGGGLHTIGIMLPYAPIHHLLFRSPPVEISDEQDGINLPEELGGPTDPTVDNFTALVMTSGNMSDEPIAVGNEDALNRLNGIADAFLIHNRGIHRRADDSVAAMRDGIPAIWRWGRGHVPRPVFLSEELPAVLGVGGELKNTICLAQGNKAFVSPHIGDIKTYETYEYFRESIEHQMRILDIYPVIIACDMHPDYESTRWAGEFSQESGLPLVKLQHHHAHAVALLAEHGMTGEDIIALVMDGTGYGVDGAIWGGEVLRAGVTDFARVGQFSYAPLPCGDVAIKEVWRTALGRLCGTDDGLPDEFRPLFNGIQPDRVRAVEKMIRADVNCPKVDSLGRLFDAAAFVSGIGMTAQYDGQFPMLLEAACGHDINFENGEKNETLTFVENLVTEDEDGKFMIDGEEIISELARLRIGGATAEYLARLFHRWVIEILEKVTLSACGRTGINTAGLTGGCFMNKILHEELKNRLEQGGIKVLTHRIMPPNDGCISLGQAVSAGYQAR